MLASGPSNLLGEVCLPVGRGLLGIFPGAIELTLKNPVLFQELSELGAVVSVYVGSSGKQRGAGVRKLHVGSGFMAP